MTPDQLAATLGALGYGAYVPIVTTILYLLVQIVPLLPPATAASPRAWQVARAVLDLLAGNWGSARNAVPVAASQPSPSTRTVAAPLGALLLLATLPLAGCTGTVTPRQEQQLTSLISGARAVEAGLSAAAPQLLAAIPAAAQAAGHPLSPAQIAALTGTVNAALTNLHSAVASLAAAPTLTAGTTYVRAIEQAANTIVTVAAGLPVVPEPAHTALVVASLALPPLEALVGTAVTQGTALAATVAAGKVSAAGSAAP